jgi:hypothetical protein
MKEVWHNSKVAICRESVSYELSVYKSMAEYISQD